MFDVYVESAAGRELVKEGLTLEVAEAFAEGFNLRRRSAAGRAVVEPRAITKEAAKRFRENMRAVRGVLKQKAREQERLVNRPQHSTHTPHTGDTAR